MPISDLLLMGLNLMAIGMGIVFSFLMLLVFSMLGMSKLALTPEKQVLKQTEAVATHPIDQSSDQVRADVVAVIAAAITRYRRTQI